MSSVEEDADLRILDPRKLDAQGRKAIAEMEKIRKRLEAEAKKADKARNSVSGAPGDIANRQPGFGQTKGKIFSSQGLTQGQAPFIKSSPWKDSQAKIKKLEETALKREKQFLQMQKSLSDVQGALNDPIGLIFNKISGKIPKSLLKGGIIATIVLTVAEQVLQIVKDTFGPGGINDIRKAVLDEARTIPDVNTLVAIENGSVFFTSDTRVRQKVAQSSNTEGLDVQSQRFNELSLGREMSAR